VISVFWKLPFVSILALIYSLIQVSNLLSSLGKRLPFKELIISITAVQLLLAPFLQYYYFKFKIYGNMNIDAITYYSYALPSLLMLHIGLELFYPSKNFEVNLFKVFSNNKKTIELRGFFMIVAGYLAYGMTKFTGGYSSLDFIIYLIAFTRFIGFLYIWLSGSRFTFLAFIAVIVPFTIEAINESMFVQIIVLFSILMTIYYMKHKTSKITIYLTFVVTAMILVLVQSVKYAYRSTIIERDFTGNKTVLFTQSVIEQVENINMSNLKPLLGTVNVRINQGWILSDIINNLKNKEDKIKPEYFKKEVLGIILPRFIYSGKPTVGDHEKFHDFTGWRLSRRVAMSVGVMGDGYGNFGALGGMLYCLGFGILLGLIFNIWNKFSLVYPSLYIWGVLIFFYSMRAGDESYIIINWIVKSSVFVFIYFLVFERKHKIEKYIPVYKKAAIR
jgi:hypothetical protein